MNAFNFLIVVIIILLCVSYKSEGWIPWVWNIPTRDIYPPIYYNTRCSPPVYHFYEPPPINPEQKLLLVKPMYLRRRNCPYDF
jgi:hypothetical protein